MNRGPSRREALLAGAAMLGGNTFANCDCALATSKFRLATFSADVTPPIGHALMGGGIAPVRTIEDPLSANGLVLMGEGQPLVLAAIDWCEIRNDAYERWRSVLAEALGTAPERVLVCCLHQHDAPIADLAAQRFLDQQKAVGSICDLAFHELAVQRVARAAKASLQKAEKITHFGTGQGKVERVASNRRFLDATGKLQFHRMSATRDAAIRAMPEGTIDPYLKTLSFWKEDKAVAAISCYATHPMSHYGRGGVSSDFVGLARKRLQADDPAVFQIYVSGCSGNVTAGKYNDGSPENRQVLAERIYQGMKQAWKNTRRSAIDKIGFRNAQFLLKPRGGPGFSTADLRSRLASDPKPFGQCLAALGLSWRKRAETGKKIDMPVLDFGSAQLLLLPGESYVEFQLLAQKLRPDSFVMTLGYGECSTGYVPIEKAFAEGDSNLSDWCWVAPGSERALTTATETALGKSK